MGKRVNFCARSVASGDNNLALDEIGIPRSVAQKLTVPVRVARYNIGRVTNGCMRVKYIVKNAGKSEEKRYDVTVNKNPLLT